jgi:hypothetical protein
LLWQRVTNPVHPEKAVLNGNDVFKELLSALLERGHMSRGEDDDAFYGRFNPLPDPASLSSGWQLPALLSTLHGAAGDALPETPAPPGFVGSLYLYQQCALTWMLARALNSPVAAVGIMAHRRRRLLQGTTLRNERRQ